MILTDHKNLQEAYCRKTLIKVLHDCQQDDEELMSILRSEEMMTNLDDLIHNTLSSELFYASCTDNKYAAQKVKDRIQKILSNLQENVEGFDKFLVDDLLARGKLTLEKLKDNEVYQDFSLLSNEHVQSMNDYYSSAYVKTYTKISNMLEPENLNILTRMFLDLKFFKTVDRAEFSAAFFDLHLIYGVLFFTDRNGASESAKQLIV
jgi:hypothetical protein